MVTEPFLAQLAELSRQEPTRAKWVFVPAHAVGLTLGDRLARQGHGWANLRFVTPLDIAVRMAAPFLLERGIDPSGGDGLGPALVMRLLLDLPEEGGYFREMAAHPSMADALWRAIRELRYAGVRADDLAAAEAVSDPRKRSELASLVAAYERHLADARLADMPMVLDEARHHQDWCPIAPTDVVTEWPDATWSPLVRQFLDSLPGRRIAPRVAALPGVPVPSRAAPLGPSVEWTDLPAPTDASRLRFLQSPATALAAEGARPASGAASPPDGSLDIFHAGGREAEVDEVCRRIVAAGCSLDQVEIACASAAYQQLVREKAARLGWKVTVSSGVPAAMTRPGRLLLRYCDWIAGGFDAADLRKLLQSGDCRPDLADEATPARGRAHARPGADAAQTAEPGGDELTDVEAQAGRGVPGGGHDRTLSPGQAARLLLKAQATSGRATYRASLTRLAEMYARKAGDEERSVDERAWHARKLAQAKALDAWIERALGTVPEPGTSGTGIPLAALVGGAIGFLEANAGRASAIDALAHVALADALNDLRPLGDHRSDLATALRFVRQRVDSLAVGRDRPRPGHLHVSSLDEAGHDGRPVIFAVGMQEGGVFPLVLEDPVLLDGERRALSPLLRTSADQQDEAVHLVLSRLAAAGVAAARVTLSFSCFDTREFRATFPSWLVLQAFRLKTRRPEAGYDDLAASLGEPVSAVPEAAGAALSDDQWWLVQAKKAAEPRRAILLAFGSLASGIRAGEERASAAFTSFDGLVPRAGAVLDPVRSRRPVSATTLESAAKCPLRFFMEQGLGVRPIEEGGTGADGWLDPLTRGAELHALFARSVRAIRDEEREPDLQEDQRRLRTWARQRLDELRIEIPPPSSEVFERESREFLDDVEAFIQAECEGRHGRHPVGVEVAFGFPQGDGGAETLADTEPIAIDLGGRQRILLHGRIDRINRVRPGEYEVADYKTGGYWRDDWQGEFAGGTRLQHALYGVAATELLKRRGLKGRVVRGVYLFPSVKGYRQQKVIPAPTPSVLAALLRDLSAVIANGAFVPADDGRSCRWCRFEAACQSADVNRAAAKRDNPANTMLEPVRRLRTHE